MHRRSLTLLSERAETKEWAVHTSAVIATHSPIAAVRGDIGLQLPVIPPLSRSLSLPSLQTSD